MEVYAVIEKIIYKKDYSEYAVNYTKIISDRLAVLIPSFSFK